MLRDREDTAAAGCGYRFSADQLLGPAVFPRVVSTLLIRPETRRSVLFAGRQGRMPAAHLEIIGLVAPDGPGRLTIYLRRENAMRRTLVLGQIGFRTPTSPRRRSRQLCLAPDALAMIMAASACEILGAWRPDGGACESIRALRCLDMRLLLTWPSGEG